jgi:hypothetical protein
MSRYLGWFFLAVVTLAASAPLQALQYEVGGCRTGSGYKNFTTISAAVAGVPAGATILVCPGVYPEQVTITQPLTLKGIASGNANRAVISINPNASLAPNVTSIDGQPFYAQVLVQNVSPAGPANLTGITVDGAGGNPGCLGPSTVYLAGIFYASDTSGTVNEVTARNQVNSGCAWGIWVENGSSTYKTITVENSSLHDQGAFGGGIASDGPTLTANISGNFLTNGGGGNAIIAYSNGGISGNVVTSSTQAGACQICAFGPQVVSGNTLADDAEGLGIEGTTAVESNKLSNVATAILNFDVTTPIKSNTIKNTVCAIDFYLGESSSGPISGNIINDAQYGFAEWSGPTITGNSLYNIDTI